MLLKKYSDIRNDSPRRRSGLLELPIGELTFLPFAECRTDKGLMPLAKSISMLGVLEPVTVRRRGDGCFEVVCGQRRVRAAGLAGLKHIPCMMTELSDSGAYAARLSSMLHIKRSDIFQTAELLGRFCTAFHFDEQQAAMLLGLPRNCAARMLRLLSFPREQRLHMSAGGLNEHHAELILARPLAEREELIGLAVDKQMSPAELERHITARQNEEKKRRSYLRRAAVLSDRRLFFNTVDKAVRVLKLAGVAVTTEKKQCGGCTELTIRFPDKQ